MKLRHFWAQIVSWAPRHAQKTFIVLAPGWVLQSLSNSPFGQRFHISAFSGFLFLVCSLWSCLSIAAWLKMLKNIMVSCTKCAATQCVRYMEDRQIHEDLRYIYMFLCSAVSSQLDCSKRFTCHPMADVFVPTCGFSGKHSAILLLLCEDYSLIYFQNCL